MQPLKIFPPVKHGFCASDCARAKRIAAVGLQVLQCLAAAFLIYQTFTDYNDPYRSGLPVRFYFEAIGAGILLIGAYGYHFWKLDRKRYDWVRVVPDPSLMICFAIAGSITSAALVTRVIDRIVEEGDFSSVPDPSRVKLMVQNQNPINQATIFTTTTLGMALFTAIFTAAVYCNRNDESSPLIEY